MNIPALASSSTHKYNQNVQGKSIKLLANLYGRNSRKGRFVTVAIAEVEKVFVTAEAA